MLSRSRSARSASSAGGSRSGAGRPRKKAVIEDLGYEGTPPYSSPEASRKSRVGRSRRRVRTPTSSKKGFKKKQCQRKQQESDSGTDTQSELNIDQSGDEYSDGSAATVHSEEEEEKGEAYEEEEQGEEEQDSEEETPSERKVRKAHEKKMRALARSNEMKMAQAKASSALAVEKNRPGLEKKRAEAAAAKVQVEAMQAKNEAMATAHKLQEKEIELRKARLELAKQERAVVKEEKDEERKREAAEKKEGREAEAAAKKKAAEDAATLSIKTQNAKAAATRDNAMKKKQSDIALNQLSAKAKAEAAMAVAHAKVQAKNMSRSNVMTTFSSGQPTGSGQQQHLLQSFAGANMNFPQQAGMLQLSPPAPTQQQIAQ